MNQNKEDEFICLDLEEKKESVEESKSEQEEFIEFEDPTVEYPENERKLLDHGDNKSNSSTIHLSQEVQKK